MRFFIFTKKSGLDFDYTYAVDVNSNNSKFGITFSILIKKGEMIIEIWKTVNGWKQEFVLTNIIPSLMVKQIENYNDIIECLYSLEKKILKLSFIKF